MSLRPFHKVAGLKPGRSVFNLSHYKLFDADMGIMYPILCKKMLPGDKFKIQNRILIRANPMVAPIMHNIDIYTRYFYVPLRILWPKPKYKTFDGTPVSQTDDVGSWEEFITGGQDGKLEPIKPNWPRTQVPPVGSLWDHFGYSMHIGGVNADIYPDAFPKRAYNMVWNEFIRHPDFQDPVDLDDEQIKRVNWGKDYFTTASYSTQRGFAPALPISGGIIFDGATAGSGPAPHRLVWNNLMSSPTPNSLALENDSSNLAEVFKNQWLNNNHFDAQTFDVNDLRLAFQIQKYLERSMRGGGRYIEHLKAHYGVSPRDDRLQRPEYIGGTKDSLIISEVLQTSSTIDDGVNPRSAQGNLAGHGISVQGNHVGVYYAQEFGVLLGVMYMRPDAVYQNGIPREWLGQTRFDEFMPEFVNIGEQEVLRAELFANSGLANRNIFGFQGRYDEYRYAQNYVSGRLRSTASNNLDHWHLARNFEEYPRLNSTFLTCVPRKDFLAVPSESAFIVQFGNIIRAVRPLPIVGTPGLIDHN